MIDKYESRKVRVQIRHTLLQVWDPIGVKDAPNAQDEYDGYIGGLYELLIRKVSDNELVEYLYLIVYDRMGLNASRSDMASTVEALRKIVLPTESM